MDQAVAPTPHITQIEISSRPALAQCVRAAFEDALAGLGSMDERVGKVDGFCGQKHRLFFNNLTRSVENPRYLEVGIFRGATLCAAIAGNKVRVTGVDNWTEYGGKAAEFYTNLAAIRGPEASVTIIEQDFRTVPYAHIGKFNIYFYDGPHSIEDQYDGIRMAMPALDDQAILLIDDWNWQHVRDGAFKAVRDAGRQIDFSIELRTSFDNAIPPVAYGQSDWHNGMFAAVISKQHVG
jgi:hypothetical protein